MPNTPSFNLGLSKIGPLAMGGAMATREVKRWRLRAAWAVAGLADAAQLALIPLFSQGALSPFEDVLDVGVGVALTALVGFHWSFAPAFLMELVPMVDLAPTWTGAVFLATRNLQALTPPSGNPG